MQVAVEPKRWPAERPVEPAPIIVPRAVLREAGADEAERVSDNLQLQPVIIRLHDAPALDAQDGMLVEVLFELEFLDPARPMVVHPPIFPEFLLVAMDGHVVDDQRFRVGEIGAGDSC